ncbi:MAG: alpha/beta hydrolase-fold protein [Putridiphycobacter sp.]|nr:alpha/beta hydrolase-fold protein [Putridiphycobacter sp.]
MKKILVMAFIITVNALYAQTTTSFLFHSDVLNEDRNIRIHLPKSFDSTNQQQYPLTLVLDGEYLFYALMGVGEVLQTRNIIPESIVVGIDQNYVVEGEKTARWIDCSYDFKTGKIGSKAAKFKTFIDSELVPFLVENYHVGPFKSIAGHSFTANYINFFLDGSLFNGFMAFSPYIPEPLEDSIEAGIQQVNRQMFYFLCTGENDLSGHISQIKRQDTAIFKRVNNNNFHYDFKNYIGESHMSLTVRGASDALSFMYSGFAPLYTLNNDSVLMKETDLIFYLEQRYKNMASTYGISMPYREDDITTIAWIIEEQEDWDALRKIGVLTTKLFPESVYGYYMLGLSEEKKNNLHAALAHYKAGYAKLGVDILNKSDFYVDIERVEKMIKEK